MRTLKDKNKVMEPLNFKEATHKLAKSQPQYRVLPVCIKRINSLLEEIPVYEYTCKYEFSNIELAQAMHTKSVYFTQTGSCFHPILPQLESHFGVLKVIYFQQPDGLYEFNIKLPDSAIDLKDIKLSEAIPTILELLNNELTAEQLYFEAKKTLGLDATGNLVMM